MPSIISPNMNLTIPSVGTQPGPEYANNVNNSLTVIDNHNHTPGSGIPISPSGLNINADLTFNSNNATGLRSVRFASQGSPLALGSDVGCLYEVVDDLYYNDGAGNQIRITQGGAIAGTPGSIGGLVAPASLTYSVPDQTFIFSATATIPAKINASTVKVRQAVASGFGVSLIAPGSLAADYDLTLPVTPAATQALQMSSTGVVTTASQGSLVPPGSILPYGGTSAPAGYLLCDGTSYLRTAYPDLFAAINTAYGTASITTFNVPDLRGYFLRGVSGASGADPDAASRVAPKPGANTGNNVGSEQGDLFASHNHSPNNTFASDNHGHALPFGRDGGTTYYGAFQNSSTWQFGNIAGTTTPASISLFGSGLSAGGALVLARTSDPTATATISTSGGNETRPKNIYVNYIIKT